MNKYKNKIFAGKIVALLTVCYSLAGFSVTASAGEAVLKSVMLKNNTHKLKKVRVRNHSELDKALDLAARDSHSAIVITCHPPTNKWCAGEFQTKCTDAGGGLSTEPDGGIACSNDNY